MATNRILSTGVPNRGPIGQVPARQNIFTLLADPDMRNLYLLGLERMQTVRPSSDPKSWFQIGGIHGRPYEPYGGARDPRDPNDRFGGYCCHSSELFLPWHRPYLALFEQVLHEDVNYVAGQFPEPKRARLVAKAKNFRVPYLDWAARRDAPNEIYAPTITVERPDGSKPTIRNPLASYRFRQGEAARLGFSITETRRATDLDDVLAAHFAQRWGAAVNTRDRVWRLLSLNGQTYQSFSNNKWNDRMLPGDYDSCEGIHDGLHIIIGGPGGTMTSVDIAGFDPIFWLHHCNVDRLWALWQAMNPQRETAWNLGNVNTALPEITPWNNTGGPIENLGLLPFRKSIDSAGRDVWWTVRECRDFKAFNHTYPELKNWGVSTREALASEVIQTVRALYGPGSSPGRIMPLAAAGGAPSPFITMASGAGPAAQQPLKKDAAAPAAKPEEKSSSFGDKLQKAAASVSSSVSSVVPKADPLPLDKLVHSGKHHEYVANIRAPKFDFNGSFEVHVFLGKFSEDYKNRPTDPNLVGTYGVLANDIETTQCGECKKGHESGLIVSGTVPLTGALLDRISEIGSLEPNVVTPYLKKNLHWRIHKMDDAHTNIPREGQGRVKFSVACAEVEAPKAKDALPVYGPWTTIYDITEGRPTGAGPGEA